MPAAKTWNILDLLQTTADFFRRKGFEDARLDAELLLAQTLGIKRIDLYVQFERPLTDAEVARYRELVALRIKPTPVAYILGRAEFMSLPFFVDGRVLIPRPETEHIVEKALQICKGQNPRGDVWSVLEIGTGSGCIAGSLAKLAENVSVLATDISEDALVVARQNIIEFGLRDKVEFLLSDVYGVLPPERRFDLILANPPYIPTTADAETLSPEVKANEPHLALFGGEDGLFVIREILAKFTKHIQPGGHLLMEVGFDQKDSVESLCAKYLPGCEFVWIKDYGRVERVLWLKA